MPFQKVTEFTGKKFFWARIQKVPYLSVDEANGLLAELQRYLVGGPPQSATADRLHGRRSLVLMVAGQTMMIELGLDDAAFIFLLARAGVRCRPTVQASPRTWLPSNTQIRSLQARRMMPIPDIRTGSPNQPWEVLPLG
jgi:hypothetical protein